MADASTLRSVSLSDKFEATDGQKTRRFTLRITVASPLIFTGEPP